MTTALPCWPPQLTDAQRNELTNLATSYALSNGLAYLPLPQPGVAKRPNAPTSAIHAPFALFPSPFPRKLFEQAQRLQHVYNVLYARVAQDVPFLDRVLGTSEGVGRVDEFVGSLWTGWKAIRDENSGSTQSLHLGLFRSDYLLHQATLSPELSIKQVEFNTISSSFGSLSERTAALHRYLHNTTGYYGAAACLNSLNFPPNSPIAGLTAGMVAAHKAYGSPSASILFVVQPGERNLFDQRWLEYELTEKHSIRVIRQTFNQLFSSATVTSTGDLTLSVPERTESIQVSVVYYRAAYTPADYPTPQHYEMRFLLERSRAIKCPTIPLQLAGTKKVQQVLTNPGVLESFLQDTPKWGDAEKFTDDDLAELRATWMDMWGMGEEDAVTHAKSRADDLVLKPQREGGGNNIYRSQIPAFLDTLPEKEREAWIAMELIHPPPGMKNLLAKAGEGHATEKDVVSELGVYGWALFGTGSSLQEQEAGWLLRTKGRESDEGGVAVGYSVLDSVVLV
ncbi:hypothetical protein FRB99_004032 [Tulasnella sp. 403]|nr:hypothetical protein FRB99_004032 [Tulasnella sp. 403]